MSLRRLAHLILSSTLILSLLLSSAPPAAAQDSSGATGGSLFLPLAANGAEVASSPVPGEINLFRTRIAVRTPAQWRDLVRTGALVLERGEAWALVLADDAQLTDLARWGFTPEETNALGTLVNVVAASDADSALAASFGPLLGQIETANGVLAADAAAGDALRAQLRQSMAALVAEQIGWLAQAAGVDTDADGLTDDQESFWCTDPARVDSDFDGTRDGAEVTAIKAWMNNALAKAPSTGKPFQGWPHQKVNCYDDDQDSVPDMAESLEVGLSANRESTDRDKFDDGQELFGNTYCPGTSGYCSYGALPRNEDWGVIFAEMPSWVKAPGHHPLVAGFPVPEVDVTPSSLHVQTVSIVTIDRTISQGTERSYSTAETNGTSSSIADTVTWNEWEEVSRTVPDSVSAMSRQMEETTPGTGYKVSGAILGFGAALAVTACIFLEPCGAVAAFGAGLGLVGAGSVLYGEVLDSNTPIDQHDPDSPKKTPATPISAKPLPNQATQDNQTNNSKTQDRSQNNTQSNKSVSSSNNVYTQKTYEITFPMQRPTTTTSKGKSRGGARTLTHTEYEEHTVTNGEAFSSEESWGTATAVDSAHAADLWFTYKVRNTGTEYAREITNLAFNLYIGDDPNPATTYFVAADIGGAGKFVNFMPAEEHTYTTQRIPLSLEQMKAIDLGGPIRIVVEEFAYGIDELFYQDAANAGVVIAMEDGTDDGDEAIDTYLIPTWGSETVLNVLGRYFPHETDLNGMMTAIWTPEYRSDTPAWCQEARRPTDQPSKAVWCKHTLSTADWWNVYTDGLGDGSEGFQDTPAVPGATALFRFNQDSDLDGFSDRSEARLGSDAADASSFPRPEVLAGVHNIQVGNKVTSTLSLLNTGLYDAYGVEAVMVAPDDSITIDNNTVGGSGRVKALKQVIVGSRLSLQSPLPAAWTQAIHAVPAPGGYYTGSTDRTYTFTVNCATAGGCKVGEGSWTLNWSDGAGNTGNPNFGAGYKSPTFVAVGGLGLTLALYTGSVQNGESFTVAATTPRDTFQYTVNRAGHTPPLVIVSYNDPQGNHRFVVPSQAMSLTAPTDNLQPFAGQMLQEVGVEIVTSVPFTTGANSVQLLVNNPSDATLPNARLFLEFIDISGTVVSEVATPVTLPPGPTYTPVSFNTGSFSPPFDAAQDYIVMAFLTDYQGNILDTAGRPLSSFQADPLPKLAVDAATLTWTFGTVAQGALLKHSPALANVGYGRLYTYLTPTPGLSLATRADVVGAADLSDYALILRTADLPIGAYDQTATLKSSDPTQPSLTVRVQGTVTAATGDTAGGLQRPLDVPVTVTGPKSQGEWVDFTHTLGSDAQSLHPVKVYPQEYTPLYGVGKYATDFAAGTASYDMFGDGRDGEMPGSGNLDNNNGFGIAIVNSGSAGATSINVTDAYAGWRINPGDVVLIHQSQGNVNGCWEFNKAVSDFVGGTSSYVLARPLKCNYVSNAENHAQIIRVPQYSTCNVTGTLTPISAWNGSWGGIFAVMCNGDMNISGAIVVDGFGYRGGQGGTWSPNYPGGGYGESYAAGPQSARNQENVQSPPNGGAGRGGVGRYGGGTAGGGGGGGYGSDGGRYSANGDAGYGGTAYGTPDFSQVWFGSGGGGGGKAPNNDYNSPGGNGGGGGGFVALIARSIVMSGGSIRANGTNGGDATRSSDESGGGGGGAGGSIYIKSRTSSVGSASIAAVGGNAGRGSAGSGWENGGAGGIGRIRIEYCESTAGSTNPTASTQKLTCYVAEQTESAPYMTGRLNLPENVTTSKTYAVQYARRLSFAAASSQTTTLRVPAGMASTATLQALVSGLPAGASFALDIGANGSDEWTGTLANASTNDSPDLAAAFNAYWVAQGAPVTGNLDVPVKVTMSQPGQVLLSNLQFSTSGSKQRTLRLPAQPVSAATLDLALGGSGERALSIAVDVGADGSLDWTSSLSTTLPVRLTTGSVAAAINAYLAGKSGLVDVPLRIFVAPDLEVKLYDASISVQPAVDLAAGGLSVGGAVAANGSNAAAYLEGDTVPVQATLSNPSSKASGPVTAAFFATAEGWGDWYIGSAFVANIPAGGSAPVSIVWETTGFNGVVPVKVVVNPYGRTPETSPANNTATVQVSITPLNPPPVVDFAATPTLGGAPLSVQFTSIVTNTVTTYAWDFGDGQVSSAAQPAHQYAAAGVYTVTLTVSGPGGSATKRKTSYITVTNTPTSPTAAFSASPTIGAAPLTVSFTNHSTGTITGYMWSFGDGQSSSIANPSHQYAAPGVYTVALTASGPGSSDVETKSGYITVQAAPVAAFSASPTTGAAPLAVQFTDASTGSVTAWQWSFGDGEQSSAQHPAHSYQNPGGYTVTLTVSGPGGSDVESKSAYITVASTSPDAPRAAFTAAPEQGAAPLPVQFTDASTGTITAWVWSFGDGEQSSERSPAHTYPSAGVFTATLTVSGPSGWHSTAMPLRVTPPLPAFTADPPAAGGLTVPFAFTPPPGVTRWLWDFGDGQTSTEQNPVHTYAAAGDYTVRLTVFGPGEVSASQEQIVMVRAGVPNPADYHLYLPHVRQ